ncbi:MFS transporter [Catenulispora sp. NF23]|uniref:MFS transporter n=1 Tax=Catenulispora pinistramenti TaxID=2705254 RepID=A0ABS5L5U1_9ACTN|nr:MFS transporter [Catenulispora pinistramenti]MBS2553514.1 MFS transporter [Catenulispora pinistramenti]
MRTDPEPGPVVGGRRWLILVVLCLATLVLVVDNMVLTVAVPALTESLHASAQNIQWVLDSYILVFAGLLLTTGSLSDRFGRRRVLIIGLAVFGVASAVATLASSPGELIAARVAMGIGGALLMPSTLSILITVFTDEAERRKAMAAWTVVLMVGMVGGPVLGGVLISHFWWGSVFLINIPIAALAIVSAMVLMPESKGPWRKPDPLGTVLSIVGLTSTVWVIIELPKGLARPSTLAALGIAVVTLVSFGIWETHIPEPMVPLRLFKQRNFAGGSLSLALVQIGNGGLVLVMTQYLQFVLGYSALKASLCFIPLAVAALVFNTLGAGLGMKFGNRPLVFVGLLICAVAFAVLAGLGTNDGLTKLFVGMALLGAGSGLAMPAAINAIMGTVPPEHAGVSSALNDTLQQTGAALGVAIMGTLVASRFTASMPADITGTARHSLGQAMATRDAQVIDAARHAFTHAESVAYIAGGIGALAAAIVAVAVVRNTKPPTAPAEGDGDGDRDGVNEGALVAAEA